MSYKKRERELARACALTIVTIDRQDIHRPSQLLTAMAQRAFGLKDEPARYDLLAYHSLDAMKREENRDILAGDILKAVSLHASERVLVAGPSEGDAAWLAYQLSEHEDLADRGIVFKEAKLPQRAKARGRAALVLSCMDWRLHGYDLRERVSSTFGLLGGFDVMTAPGAAKELAYYSPRLPLVAEQVREAVEDGSAESLIILSHEDCGAYGGCRSFRGPKQEGKTIERDLRRARQNLKNSLPFGFPVHLGLLGLDGDRVSTVRRLERV